VVIRAATEDEALRAARSLRAIGVLEIAGYVLQTADDEHTEPVTLDELEQLVADDAVEVLDVREPSEHADGYIPGSRNVPYRLVRRCADVLATEKPIVTVCESGPRAAVAASALVHEGLDARPVLGGGVTEWEERHQTVAFRRCGDS